MRQRFRRHVLLVGALVLAATCLLAAGTAVALPAAAALACPACYGFRPVGSNVFIERATSPDREESIAEIIRVGKERTRQFWGPLQADPLVFVCETNTCFEGVGGGRRRGMSLFDKAAYLSPRGTDPVIAAHELSMNELHRRIGFQDFITGRIPIWFNEGVAIFASDDLRYISPVGTAERCLVKSNDALPVGMFEWNRQALKDNQLYAKAACRVAEWIAAKGGSQAVTDLVARVAGGMAFETAYR